MSVRVLKFGAVWCGPCKMIDPILHELEDEFPDVEFNFIDVEESPDMAISYGVMGVPRVMIYKEDQKVEDFTGYKPKEFINDLIVSYI